VVSPWPSAAHPFRGRPTKVRDTVNVQKAQILAALRSRNLTDRAAWVDRQLPDVVDTEKNRALLEMLGIDVADLPVLDAASPVLDGASPVLDGASQEK